MSQAAPFLPSTETQPVLLEVEPDAGTITKAAKQYVHTGKIVTKDEERAAKIATRFLECGFVGRTARDCECSPNTVRAVVAVLEAEGKLEGLKQRLAAKLGLVAELATENSIELLAEGKVPANVLPVMAGVAVDKKNALEQEGFTPAAPQAGPVRVTVEIVAGYLAKRGIAAPALDVESTVQPAQPAAIQALAEPSYGPSYAQPGQDEAERERSEAVPGAGGGGGDATAAEPKSPDTFTLQ